MEQVDKANVQYNDMKGTAALDWHGGSELHDLASKKGVPEDFFPVAITLYLGERRGQFGACIYAVEKATFGYNANDIQKNLMGRAAFPVTRFEFDIDLPELRQYMKRFSVVLKSHKIMGDKPLDVGE